MPQPSIAATTQAAHAAVLTILVARFIAASLTRTGAPVQQGDGRSKAPAIKQISATGDTTYRSTHMAMPMPPPMHSVARPFLALRFCIS